MGQHATSMRQQWQRTLRFDQVKRRHEEDPNYLNSLGKKELRSVITLGERNTRILLGVEDLSDWSQEELIRGRRLNKNGNWTGKKPKVVPTAVHDELVKRTLLEAQDKLRDSLVEAVSSLAQIALDETVDPKDRVKAISIIIDRVMGKAPERVKVEGPSKWQKALNAGIVATDEEVIEANVVDEDDDDDDTPSATVIDIKEKTKSTRKPAAKKATAKKQTPAPKKPTTNKKASTAKTAVKTTDKKTPPKKGKK